MPLRAAPLVRAITLVAVLPGVVGAQDTTAAASDTARPLARPVGVDTSMARRPFLGIGQALTINLLVNRVDAWVLRADWAQNAGLSSWRRNLRLGWEWDEDGFRTNMFGHPYHGGLYFNAGRDNGLSYWEAAPLAFLGSWTWEYFGESYRPSLNDFFMTSFGGIALGEMFHRLAATVRNETLSGAPRTRREILALPLDPIGGLNRLVRGQWSGVRRNPPEHDPGAFVLRLHGGARFARGLVTDSAGRMWAVVADLFYGDPFLRPYRAPFDVFNVRAILSGGGGFNVLRASGRLYGRTISGPQRRTQHLFAINQRYDYISNPAQSVGGQSVEFGIYSRWRLGRGSYGLRTAVFTDVILLGAIDAPNTGLGERNYDFGPGAGLRGQVGLERSGLRFLTLFGQAEYVHAVSGASADHAIWFVGGELNIPLVKSFGLALHVTKFTRTSNYSTGLRDRREYPELRILGVWTRFGFNPSP
jgi:hypothetical protein